MSDPLTGIVRRLKLIEDYLWKKKTFPTPQYLEGTWVPTFTGFSANPAGGIYRYTLIGHMCTLFVFMPYDGTSNNTTFTMTAPFTSASVTSQRWGACCWIVVDNSNWQTDPGEASIVSGLDIIEIYKTISGDGWTNSGNKKVCFTLTYEVIP